MSTPEPGRTHRHLWIVLLLLQGSLFAFAIGDRRAVTGGATRECFLLQQAALTGAPQGVSRVDRSSRFVQDGLLQQVLELAPGAAAAIDVRIWFYLGLLLDELLLLVGIWLLARSLFTDLRTVFFVAVATIGSSLWVDHVWANFRSFHALPLLLWMARTYRSTGSPLLLAAAFNLAGLQAIGKPPGQALLAPLAALLAMSAFRNILEPARPIVGHRWRGALAAGAASWIPVAILAAGGPAAAPRPFLQSVLDFSSVNNPGTFLDAALGIAPAPDFTLYCGFFTLGFAILAVVRTDPRTSLRVAGGVAILVLVLSLAAATGDRLFPSVHSARSAAGAPLLRLVLILLAGAGFEQTLRRPAVPGRAVPFVAWGLVLFGAALILASILLRYADFREGAARLFVAQAPEGTLSPLFKNKALIRELLDMSALWAVIAGGVMMLARPGARSAGLAIALILFLHPLDVFGWKFRMTWLRTKSQSEVRAPASAGDPDRFIPAPRSKVAAGLLGVQALVWIAAIIGVTARMRHVDHVHAKSTVG